MKKSMRVIAASLSVLCAMALLLVLYAVIPGGSDSSKANTTTEVGDVADSDAEAVAKAAATKKVQEFEAFHTQGRIQTEAIADWLNKYDIPFKKNANGNIIVDASRTLGTLFPKNDNKRCNSAKKAGLSKHAISDAPEYVFDLSKKQVDEILAAEKKGIGTKVDFSKKEIKALVKADAQTMVENIIVGLAHTEQISGMYYGDSKTVYQLSSAVKYLIDETKKAWKTKDDNGDIIGVNRWLEYDETEKKWYANEDYVANIIAVVNQIVDGCEPEVRVIHADYNWGLKRNDQIQLRRCYLSKEPDNLTAIVYKHYFKDGEIMEQPATNVRDRRPEIPTPVPSKKKAGPPSPNRTDDDPAPDPAPGFDPDPGHHKKPDPGTGEEAKPTPTPTIKPKNPDERPEERPKDDKGPGEPEPTPRVPKSPSDNVDESQYQPHADPQTGGTSTPRESIQNDPSATTSPGGQIVTDPHGDGWRIENDRASTDPIPVRDSDTGGKEGNNNGPMAPPE